MAVRFRSKPRKHETQDEPPFQAKPCDGSVNDNGAPPAVSISFSDLAAGLEADEDELLRRFAGVLRRRGVTAADLLVSTEMPE